MSRTDGQAESAINIDAAVEHIEWCARHQSRGQILVQTLRSTGGGRHVPDQEYWFGGKRTGGVVWHTQGSGKSLTMVMLAKAIVMTNPHARIVIVTDRTDLDEQISKTFRATGQELRNKRGLIIDPAILDSIVDDVLASARVRLAQ